MATHPALSKKADPVPKVDDSIRELFKDMLEVMYTDKGAGLAAPQIGISKRLLTMDLRYLMPETPVFCMANPEILWESKETKVETEYCLSVPSIGVPVERPAEVKVGYLDENGTPQEVHATGFMSYCLQHEIDHLNGITTLDHMSTFKRKLALKKLQRMTKNLQ